MPSVFISYRRDDTAGEAGRLADDLIERFGRSRVFIDVDSIPLATNFEDRIHAALEVCQVVFVLIGDRWSTAKLPSGERRLEAEHDYLRQEIATALNRDDVAVVPVLVEGAKMPSSEELPPDISALAKINAVDLSNKRWREDVRALCGIALRYDKWWARLVAWIRSRALRSILVAIAVAASVAAAVLLSSRSDQRTPDGQERSTLLPASVPSSVDLCARQLIFAVNGTVAPLFCPGGDLNSQAWQYYANGNPLLLSIGPDATPGRILQAVCSDLESGASQTIPQAQQTYDLATRYYDWQLSLPLEVARLGCVRN